MWLHFTNDENFPVNLYQNERPTLTTPAVRPFLSRRDIAHALRAPLPNLAVRPAKTIAKILPANGALTNTNITSPLEKTETIASGGSCRPRPRADQSLTVATGIRSLLRARLNWNWLAPTALNHFRDARRLQRALKVMAAHLPSIALCFDNLRQPTQHVELKIVFSSPLLFGRDPGLF